MREECTVANVPECFISAHEGFRGSIKHFTKDFVVTEIDINGQLVHKPNVTLSDSPQLSGACGPLPVRRNEACTECKPGVKQGKCSPVTAAQDTDIAAACKNGDDTILNPETFDLSLILGHLVNEELERFVITLKDVSGAAVDGAEKLTRRRELSLGMFPDKHQRANVHRAVKHHFPFLMTVTDRSEIRVKEDPDFEELSRLVTEEEAEDFFRFMDAKEPGSSYTFRHDDNKEHRTAVHHFLSRRFGKLVETKSFSEHGKTAITVRLRERGRPKKRTADDCKQEEIYTAFTLCKENLETLEAISYMAAALGVLPSDFTYAGIKDKRAVTYQSMVIKKVSPQRLRERTAELERRGMVVSQVRSVSEPLRLGRLQGNHFDLVVRDLRAHPAGDTTHCSVRDTPTHLAALVQQAVENVKARGFVNYYGPQRFGTGQSVYSDSVGLALLKEDMVSAVRLFFTPEEGDDPQSQAKRHFLHTDNAKESLALMPMSKARERLMLRALHRYGTGTDGCTRAWLSLPHGMRVFYPHAYCSRVWNEAVAHRLLTLGHSARQGDLVWAQGGPSSPEGAGEPNLPQIHVVTEREEEEGVYSLGQVVLPMPGNTVKYPENSMGAWYQERLARDGLTNCRFRVSTLKLNLPGCYRPLLAFPRNLTYRIQGLTAGEGGGEEAAEEGVRESSRGEDEREVQQGEAMSQCHLTTEEGGGERRREGGVGDSSRGEKRMDVRQDEAAATRDSDALDLVLSFDLDTSCYATVCLREVMKGDP